MNQKKEFISQTADNLIAQGRTMAASDLAKLLNQNNFRAQNGSQYKGGRGTFKLIRETWHSFNSQHGFARETQNIADAFVNNQGKYVYQ